MKKLILMILLALISVTTSAQSFSITFADVNVENGAGKLVVSMKKDMTVAGWQMYLYLPEGVEIAQVYDEDEEEYVADITLSSTFHKAKHSCSSKKTADGAMMLICSGGTETVTLKSATEGELCTIGLKVAEGVTSQAVAVKKVAVSDDQGVQSIQSDTTFQLIVGSTGSKEKASSPRFFLQGNQLSITTTTENASIYYTTDGNTPTKNSTKYTGPINLIQNCIVKAIAVADGYEDSKVATYVVNWFDLSPSSFAITFADVNVENGAGKLVVSMKKDMTVCGWQMYLYLPEGVEIAQVYDEDEEEYVADITLSSTFHKAKHSCSVKKTADNAMMLICSGGMETVALKSATEGELCTIGLTVADGVSSQDVAVKNIAVSDMQGIQYNQADTTFQLIIGSTGSKEKASSPRFFWYGNRLSITTTTESASIYYTTDGNIPTKNSTKYTGPITMTQNCTVKAIAVADGYVDSPVATFEVNWFKVESVTISYENKLVRMSTQTPDARIYYTLNGSTPTDQSIRYTEPFTVAANCIINAIAYKENFLPSEVTSKYIDVNAFICAVPTFQREGNSVTITCTTADATIYYTLDGSEPTNKSNVYTNPITLTQNGLLKAVATKENLDDSQIATYTIDWFKVEPVAISFVNLKVELSTTTANARIYYTLDGSTPTEYNMRYTEPFGVASNCTVNAIAFKDNFNPSDMSSLYIDLENVRCELPTFQQTDKELTITCGTEEAIIYYTLDGKDPTTESNRYEGPVTLTRNGMVKAIAVREGYLNSYVAVYEVTNFQVATPSFTVDGSVLTISCGTGSAAIYYIIGEGTLEIAEQNRYTGPITLTENNIVRAIGVLDGYHNSEVATYNHNSETCHNVFINYNGRYVTLSTTTDGASIYYTTDGSNPTTESQQYNGNPIVIDALCRINAVAMKKNLNNSNLVSKEIDFVYDGEKVVVRKTGILENAFEWHQGTAVSEKLIVKGTLNATDLDFIKTLSTVKYLDMRDATIENETLPDNAFSYTNIVSIELPARISGIGKSLFEGCNELAAIIWNANTALTEEAMTGFHNPNLLVYVNSLSLAPEVNNVVSMANNKATTIVLEDVETGNGNFYCPRPFKADQISYKRNFTLESGKQASGGWETISLPFNVASIIHEQHGLLAPFGSTVAGAKPFWLYSLHSTGFNPAMEIVANTPYIICMPNHPDYADEYNQNGYVTFSATNVEVPVTSTMVSVQETSNSSISLIPTFSRIIRSAGIYAINREMFRTFAPGSIFVENLRDVHPFEAYSTVDMYETSSHAPLFIPIADQMATAIQNITNITASDTIKVYNFNGMLIKKGDYNEVMKQLPKGVYIINGKKVVVK